MPPATPAAAAAPRMRAVECELQKVAAATFVAADVITLTPVVAAPPPTTTDPLVPTICPEALTTSTTYVPGARPAKLNCPAAFVVVRPASWPVETFRSCTPVLARTWPVLPEAAPETDADDEAWPGRAAIASAAVTLMARTISALRTRIGALSLLTRGRSLTPTCRVDQCESSNCCATDGFFYAKPCNRVSSIERFRSSGGAAATPDGAGRRAIRLRGCCTSPCRAPSRRGAC